MKRKVRIFPIKLKDVQSIKKGDLLCLNTEIENPLLLENNIKPGDFQISHINCKKDEAPNYDVYNLVFIDLEDVIDYDSNGNPKLELDEFVFDTSNNQYGHVSNLGNKYSFPGTVQFPNHKNLHFNRHPLFNVKRVFASYQEKLDIFKIPVDFVEDWIRFKYIDIEVENVMQITLPDIEDETKPEIDNPGEPWNLKTEDKR